MSRPARKVIRIDTAEVCARLGISRDTLEAHARTAVEGCEEGAPQPPRLDVSTGRAPRWRYDEASYETWLRELRTWRASRRPATGDTKSDGETPTASSESAPSKATARRGNCTGGSASPKTLDDSGNLIAFAARLRSKK